VLYIIIASILLLVAIGFGVVGIPSRDYGPHILVRRLIAAGVLAVLLIFTLAMSFTTVGARSVGIQTSFGQYRGIVQPGAQLLAPWSEVEEFSTQIQPLDLSDLDGTQGNAVSVAFSGADKGTSGGNGVVNAVVRWAIDPAKAEALWKKYRTFERVQESLVLSEAQDAFREVVGGYQPNAARAGANIRPIADAVKAGLTRRLADDGILIDSVSIKGVALDAATSKSLERTVIANNNVATARAEQERARIDNETVKLREASGALSVAANQRYCLDIVNAWDSSKNGPLPATFNCGIGPSAGVLVGAK
jgi:regulator of protease activity HflC (stomatin/prohibitin superfamily)